MVTFSTWELVGFIILIMVFYTVTLVVAAKFIGKGFSSKMIYLLPFYPLDTSKRIYAIARQLGIPESEVSYTGKNKLSKKSEYYIKSTEQTITVESFFGVVVKEQGDILNQEYHAFSAESLSQQHHYLDQRKEEGLEPVSEESITEEPITEESVSEEPVSEEPVSEEPITEESVSEPIIEEGLKE